jgi:phage replication O-like protein O
MPGPQKENGYTPIANEIMDALCKYRIPGECRQVLDCIFRMTYGFSRKEVEISNNQISVITGLKRQNVIRSIQWLESKLILSRIKSDSTKTKILKFNKNYTEWIRLESKLILGKLASKLIPKLESKLIQNANPTIIFKTNKTRRVKKTKKSFFVPSGESLKSNGNSWLDAAAWDDFVQHRNDLKKPLSELSVKKSLSFLSQYKNRQKEIIDTSIRSRWQGLFPPKGYTPTNNDEDGPRSKILRAPDA